MRFWNVPNRGEMENNIDALLDSNILIYAMKGQEKYVEIIASLGMTGISVLSHMELFIGVHSTQEEGELISILREIVIVPLTEEIALAAVDSLKKQGHKSLCNARVVDFAIAHTALSLNVPLVTNNPKDFESFEGLKLIVP